MKYIILLILLSSCTSVDNCYPNKQIGCIEDGALKRCLCEK